MTIDVAGGGHIGLALETSHGTYKAPEKFAAVYSESVQEIRTDSYRVPMVGRAVASGKNPGRQHVAGDLTMEALPEVMAYFLLASRWGANVQKTGASAPFTYSATNSSVVHLKDNSRSLTLVADRAGVGFAYLGCQVVQTVINFGDGGVPMVTYSIIGQRQTEDYTPGAVVLPTELPFSVDETAIAIAGTSPRGDIDAESTSFTLNDNGEPKFNLTGEDRADYVKFGEFIGESSYEIDFEDKADYAIWKARTAQEIILHCEKAANQIFDLEFHGAMYDTFEVSLSGIGDQVRASASARAVHNVAAGFAATLAITTDEDLDL